MIGHNYTVWRAIYVLRDPLDGQRIRHLIPIPPAADVNVHVEGPGLGLSGRGLGPLAPIWAASLEIGTWARVRALDGVVGAVRVA